MPSPNQFAAPAAGNSGIENGRGGQTDHQGSATERVSSNVENRARASIPCVATASRARDSSSGDTASQPANNIQQRPPPTAVPQIR